MVTIFLTVYGKQGLRELAEHNLAKAAYLSGLLTDSIRHSDPSVCHSAPSACHSERSEESPYSARSAPKLLFDGAPRFHEFVLETPVPAEETNTALLEHKIIGGLALAKWYPELGPNASLWCATEMTTRKQMDAAADALRAVVPTAELTRA